MPDHVAKPGKVLVAYVESRAYGRSGQGRRVRIFSVDANAVQRVVGPNIDMSDALDREPSSQFVGAYVFDYFVDESFSGAIDRDEHLRRE